jgi:hypothetical protein
MTKEIQSLLSKIEENTLFDNYPLYFIGGTALSTYLDHRISYDLDFISTTKLPISAIKAFAFSIHARQIINRASASAFRINRGEHLDNYHLKFMVDGIKIEFSYFGDPMIEVVLDQATLEPYSVNSTLKKLSLADIIKLKSIALLKREKSRDLFDIAIILEHQLLTIEELERIYSFVQVGDRTLWEYIESFDPKKDDIGDSSLDFLPRHKHYKAFAKLTQDERFEKSKQMLLEQYRTKQKELLKQKQKEVQSSIKRNSKR